MSRINSSLVISWLFGEELGPVEYVIDGDNCCSRRYPCFPRSRLMNEGGCSRACIDFC
jgi:hypothetical protein